MYCAKTRSSCCLNIPKLKGQTPLTYLTGEPTNISHLAEFGYFDMVWFISPKGPDSIQVKRLGRYTSPADTVGDALCAAVCNERLIEFHRTSVFPLSQEDKLNPKVQKKVEAFDKAMAANLDKRYAYKNSKWKLNKDYIPEELEASIFYDDEKVTPKMFRQLSIDSDDNSALSTSPLPDAEDIEIGYNNYVSAKVSIPVNGYQFSNGVVKRRARDANGELIGKANPNPLLDTLVLKLSWRTAPSKDTMPTFWPSTSIAT
jgi:hypothetical protein